MPTRPAARPLAAFPRRPATPDGPPLELRVELAEYNGHPFIALRLWARSANGWTPLAGKGVSVRLAEARGVAEALLTAIDEAGPPPAGGRSRRRPQQEQ